MTELDFPIILKNTIASAADGTSLQSVTTITDKDRTSVHYVVHDANGYCVANSDSLLFGLEHFDKVAS